MRKSTWALTSLLAVTIFAWWVANNRIGVDEAQDQHAEDPEVYVRPFEVAGHQYYSLLLAKRFSDLDQAIAAARRDDAKLSDGQPLVAAIYGGLCGCVTNGCRKTLTPTEWQGRIDLLKEWRRSVPNSVPAEIAVAEYYVEHAWSLRGTGWGHTVSSNAWAGFKNEMDTAEKELGAVSSGAKEDEEWFRAMLLVGLAQHWPRMQFDALYNAASSKYPYYMMISFVGCSYNAPRWFGSTEDLRRCTEQVAETTQSQLGESMYARINWTLETDDMFQNGQADWPRMRAGFERIVADYPDAWNVNKFGYFACVAHDAPTLIEVQKLIGSTPIDSAWLGSRDVYRQCIDAALHGADPDGP